MNKTFGFDASILAELIEDAGTLQHLGKILTVSPKTLRHWRSKGWCNYSEEVARKLVSDDIDKPKEEPLVERFGFDAYILLDLTEKAGSTRRLAQIMMVSPKTISYWRSKGWCNYSEDVARNLISDANEKSLFTTVVSPAPRFSSSTLEDLIWMVGGVFNLSRALSVTRETAYAWAKQGYCPRDETIVKAQLAVWMRSNHIPDRGPRDVNITIIAHAVSKQECDARRQALHELFDVLGTPEECGIALNISGNTVRKWLQPNSVNITLKEGLIRSKFTHEPLTVSGIIYHEFRKIEASPVTLAHVVDAYFKKTGFIITPSRAKQTIRATPYSVCEDKEWAIPASKIKELRELSGNSASLCARSLHRKVRDQWSQWERGLSLCWYPLWMVEKAARGERVAQYSFTW